MCPTPAARAASATSGPVARGVEEGLLDAVERRGQRRRVGEVGGDRGDARGDVEDGRIAPRGAQPVGGDAGGEQAVEDGVADVATGSGHEDHARTFLPRTAFVTNTVRRERRSSS